MPDPASSDHDLLIIISTKLDYLTETVRSVTHQLTEKANQADFVRLREVVDGIQKFKWQLVGAFAAINILVELFLHKWLVL